MSRQNVRVSVLSICICLTLGLSLTTSAYADRDDDDGFGHGYMMMWTDPNGELKLTDEQRKKIYSTQREMRTEQWELMEQMHTMMEKAYPLLNADKRDSKAILAAFEPMFKLRQQMLKVQIDTANRIDAELSPEQRKSLKNWRGQAYGPDRDGMGPGMMGHGYSGHGMMGGRGNGRGMMGGFGLMGG
ncbi:MAG: Spy/CpxP family protein refolding chaperone [Gammaproteobacteria bacterium]|nr:Spy/CpxP family protein refolding chaperone [Gammaproteobacteria bacterium]